MKMEKFEFSEFEKLISNKKIDEAAQLLKLLLKNPAAENLGKLIEFEEKLDLFDEKLINLNVEIFRVLRNACTVRENQELIMKSLNFNKLNSLLKLEKSELVIKIIIQFLINLIVSNIEGAFKVAEHLYTTITQCFYMRRNKYEVLALIYNLHLQIKELPYEKLLFKEIIDCYDYNCEYSRFLLELFLSNEHFWSTFNELEVTNRLLVLEVLKDSWLSRKVENIPDNTLKILSTNFSNSNTTIFQTISSGNDSDEPYEVSLLLELLSSFCGCEKYLRVLQNDKDLLINSGVVLINIHRLGKESTNCFTSIQKLNELKEPNESIVQHPAFGFKVNLVRLIGNLCWKNRKMQDLTREAEIIPILLDCCNIDARNPLIMQWVILAIRNLCENNKENQEIIAGMHKEGVVSSALIEEMGITLHNDESGGIRIVPLDLNK